MRFRSNIALEKYLANNPDEKVLDIRFSPHVTKIPPLPESLTVLGILNCKRLEELPKLPKNLCGLDIYNCPQLKKLPKFPERVHFVVINNCTALEEAYRRGREGFGEKYGWMYPEDGVLHWCRAWIEDCKIIRRNSMRTVKRREAKKLRELSVLSDSKGI